MQTREQFKNWKVVASVATVAALGVSGLAIASPGDPADRPPSIEVQDQRTTGDTFTGSTRGDFEIVRGPGFTAGDSLDSPLASASLDSPSPDSPSVDSPGSVDSSVSVDSPGSVDSSVSVDSPASMDSSVSVDSGDSLDS